MTKAYFGKYSPEQKTEQKAAYDALFTNPPAIVAIDTETPSLKDRRIMGFAIATADNDAFYFDMYEQDMPWHLIFPSSTRKIYHNAPFDLAWEVLGQYGADIVNIEDTSVITRMLRMDTELSVVSYHTQHETWSVRSLLDKYQVKTMDALPWEIVAEKCCRDVLVTMDLWKQYSKQVNQKIYERKRRFMSLLLHMSHRGMKIDKLLLHAIDDELESNMRLYFGQAEALGFNPRSGEQVAYILSEQGVFFNFKRGKTRPTVDDDALAAISHPYAALTRIARKVSKLHSTTHSWLGKDRLTSHFRADASTSRTKSADDNLQNIPTGRNADDFVPKAGKIRGVCIPDNEWFTDWDLSQIELRTFAKLSNDEEMQFYLNYGLYHPEIPKDQWPDFHTETQKALGLHDRRPAKSFNFGMLFGGEDSVLAKATGIRDLRKIAEQKRGWEQRWPVAARWIAQQRQEVKRDLTAITLGGQVLRVDLSNHEMTEKHIENCGVAFPVQGSAAEIFEEIALAIVDSGVPIEAFASAVHDQAIIDGKYELPLDDLAHTSSIWTPLEVKYLRRWE
jgi:DNA polymerase I-like protein with 3'-5' exonuclease and polymerase domains